MIGTDHFWPVQPVFKKKGWFKGESYKNSELMASNGFYVPSGLGITNQQIDYVSEKINQFFEK